jgi:hypothetical protein
MPKYDVHLFPIVRVKVSGVEAPDELVAIKKVEESVDLNNLFSFTLLEADTEYAEEIWGGFTGTAKSISHYLVDPSRVPVSGGFESVWFGPDYERGNPDPKGAKARMLDKILEQKKLLPVLLGIDAELDKLIAKELES